MEFDAENSDLHADPQREDDGKINHNALDLAQLVNLVLHLLDFFLSLILLHKKNTLLSNKKYFIITLHYE